MIAQQFRQLNVYCRHLYFMNTGHDINCCVFKYRECRFIVYKGITRNIGCKVTSEFYCELENTIRTNYSLGVYTSLIILFI